VAGAHVFARDVQYAGGRRSSEFELVQLQSGPFAVRVLDAERGNARELARLCEQRREHRGRDQECRDAAQAGTRIHDGPVTSSPRYVARASGWRRIASAEPSHRIEPSTSTPAGELIEQGTGAQRQTAGGMAMKPRRVACHTGTKSLDDRFSNDLKG
jgi:hypothetical protein